MAGRRYVLDCDPGIDDALALLALVAEPDAELVAVTTTFGNVAVEQATKNAADLLALAGRPDVPVLAGASAPLRGAFGGGATEIHGANGLGEVELPGAGRDPGEGSVTEALVRWVSEDPGGVHLISTGPLTNIARVLQVEPGFAELVGSYTLMGGAVLAPGNVSAVAEANIADDPEAAAVVFDANWTPTVLPLDVTMCHTLELADLRALHARGTAVSRAVAAMLEHYVDCYVGTFGRRCCPLHDPMAVAVAVGAAVPERRLYVPVTVDVSDGPGRGRLVCEVQGVDHHPPPSARPGAELVLSLQAPLAPSLLRRLLSY